MTDRPILFSAPMVRALLDGRKTQTRRVCQWLNNPNIPALSKIVACDELGWFGEEASDPIFTVPYVPNDRLWVREAWRTPYHYDDLKPSDLSGEEYINFEADQPKGLKFSGRLRPCMFMPRWASRLTLTVTDVRIERLQDISEADARAEGIMQFREMDAAHTTYHWKDDHEIGKTFVFPSGAYAALWNSINGPEAWDLNPWVVAIRFDVQHVNIDEVRL